MRAILVDGMFLCYSSFYAMGGVNHMGNPTGVIFGFLGQILSLAQQFHTNQIHVCWDSKHSIRKHLYPGYKFGRHTNDTPEEAAAKANMKQQAKLLRRSILPDMGIPCYIQKGYESDDLLAHLAEELLERGMSDCIIVSGDEDLLQCITRRVKVYMPNKRKLFNLETLQKEKGVTPEQWLWIKTVAGCRSDCVKGIKGVGEQTCKEYMSQFGMNAMTALAKKTKRVRLKFLKISDYIGSPAQDKVRELVELPLLGVTKEPLTPCFDWNAFEQVCLANGFDSFLEKEGQWRSAFLMAKPYKMGGRR